MKETSANFILNVISVILGIAITFVIQGMINRAGDRKEVRSALELVRSELKTNIEDIGIMTDYLTQERQSAGYLLQNLPKIDKCPEDSVNHHCGIVFADASITLSSDALELLKMSSLFQKIGDNRLAMKIIRAYDTCGSAVSNLNRHISQRNERFEEAGIPDLQAFLKSKAGSLYFRWLVNRPDPTLFADTADLQEAIDAIDAYMMK